jgi:3-deoxy-manno-octulosonate cytidylyltransferase (CMP-KDO synthetase)
MGQRVALIPARYASSRLPGKPLVEIDGKPMIQHVYERVQSARSVDRVIVATDDERIRDFVRDFGGDVAMTSSEHLSGTDRIAAVARTLGDLSLVINVQGDEPMIDPAILELLVDAIESTDCDCATPVTRITEMRELFDTNIVKVVLRRDFTPLYFSRSPIPCVRDRPAEEWLTSFPFYRHVGVYAYRPAALERFVTSPASILERCEQLEQLRMLDLGLSMICVEAEYDGHAVDTPEDVMRVEALLSGA